MKAIFVTLMFVASCCMSAIAGTPSLINYQGYLTTPGGSPVVDGSYSVVFTIYDAPSGGTSKWNETQSITTSGGLFAVLLGTITPVMDTVFNNSSRYLGIKVESDPEIAPRTQLVSTPYSYRISTVDGSTGGSISGNIILENSAATTGNIYKGGDLFIHNFGSENTFVGRIAGNLTMAGGENTAGGSQALRSNTTGFGNTALGFRALTNNTTGEQNTACGWMALVNNTTGSFNAANGVNALRWNSTGTNNTANGWGALLNNTTGFDNTAHGMEALLTNSTGSANTASGVKALYSNTTGSSNTASGTSALYSNTSGSYNTAIGFETLKNNTTGEQNTASGWIALVNNTTGSFNTAYGVNALRWNSTGANNTASGWGALLNNGTGSDNTAHGRSALLSNSTGFNNTASGVNALYSNSTGAYNTASGKDALQNNTIGTENSAIGWGALQNNTTGNNNLAGGGQALQDNTTGSQNTALGVGALISNGTGDRNTAIGYGANVASGAFSNATAIGANALVDASNKIRLGDGSVSVICGAVGFTVCSDRNLKENFQSLDRDEVLSKICSIPVTSWNYRSNDPAKFRHYGPMAQDFFAAFGFDAIGQSGDSVTINSSDLSGILMVAIQRLAEKTQDLENQTAEIAKVRTENAALVARLDLLEAALCKLATLTANSEGKQLTKK